MRALPNSLNEVFLELENFTYCFEISLKDGDSLFLTSFDKSLKYDDIIYQPFSGLMIKNSLFNDSGQDYISLEGIFEDFGINKSMDLAGAHVKILICSVDSSYHFISYCCTTYTKYDLKFDIHLQPETIKYNQNIVNVFSKTCRTNFGDSRCGIDKSIYSQTYGIIQISGRTIEVDKINVESGYYIGGDASINNGKFIAKIISSFNNVIHVDRVIPDNLKNLKKAILTAGCDKKFITCCNKFNNAVNFRGEPFIPEYNFLKINK